MIFYWSKGVEGGVFYLSIRTQEGGYLSNSNSEASTRSTLNSKAFLRKDLMKEGEWTLSVMQFQDSRPEKLRKEVEQLRTS